MNYDDDNNEEEYYNFSEEIKKKRKFTKDDATYGVFKDWDDDGYDEDTPSTKMNTDDDYYKMKKRYSTPVGFVASGIYEPNENKLKNENSDNDDDNEEEKKRKKEKKERKEKKKEKEKQQQQQKNKNKKNYKRGGLGFMNNDNSDNENYGGGSDDVEDKKVGGIGAALLSKMGYKGTGGLGRDGSGMVEPIKVSVRPKNAGLSSVSEANNNDSSSSSDDESSDEDDDENKRSLGWKKKEKLKYNFDEHIESSNIIKKKTTTSTTSSSSSPQIVIDMRGPETKLYTGIEEVKNRNNHHIHHSQDQHHQQQKPLGELKHNVELLLKLKQIDLHNQENKIKYENDKINNLTRGVDKLKLSIENDNLQIKKVTHIIELITTSKKQLDQGELNLKQLYKTFKLLKSQYSKEFQSFKLFNLEKELLEPLLLEKLNKWDIENDPSYLSNEMIKWRTLFDDNGVGVHNNVYFILIRDLILPKFKQYLRSQWDVKKPIVAATLISKWSESLPETVQEIILEQSILPKLKVAIEKWDPKKDVIPLDHWLLPWIPFLKAELETFFPSIRQKIISVLSEWHPSDQSALKFLTPWRNVFESNSMESLLNRSIIPKLSKSIKDLIINPSNQQPPIEIQWLLRWCNTTTTINNDSANNGSSSSSSTPFIPLPIIINILEKEFFARWLKILLDWLKSPNSDLEQVSNWYSGWKKQFPPEIITNDKIKSIFNIALNLMKKSLSDQPIEKIDEDIINNKISSILNNHNNSGNYFNQLQQQPIKSITTPTPHTPQTLPTNFDNLSTKQMIEQLAINNGLLFLPLQQKKTDTGHQIYLFDKIQIIIDRDLIMYNNNNKWEPANIQYLLDKSLK